MNTEYFSTLAFIMVLIVAAVLDIRFQKIPNWLTFPSMIAAIILNTASTGFPGLLFSLGGIMAGIAFMILPYLMGGMGAGDAKLMGAVGGLLGPKGVFIAFLLTALTGGVYAMGVLAFYGGLGETSRRYRLILRNFFLTGKVLYIPPSGKENKPRLRYGIAIALGSIMTVIMKNTLYEIISLN
ncbi:MAG: A24 family peptidase [Nitrospirota bacterium]|nr:A24 family peptidase [Nitrospirota bacterium]